MTDQPDLRAAVAAGVVGSEESYRALLSAIVEVARSIFGATASSILLLDEETEELVFEAVVGEGEDTLLGTRFPAGTGIAGWVLATRTPLVIEDVHNDPRWSRDVAEDTGYVPKGLMAAPLLHEEGALGVLSVLDRPEQTLFSLQEMELLGLFANQAAIAVDLLLKARRAEALLGDGGGDLAVVARLATAVDALEDEQREAGLKLLEPPGADARRGVAGATGREQERARAAVHPARARKISYARLLGCALDVALGCALWGSHRRALRCAVSLEVRLVVLVSLWGSLWCPLGRALRCAVTLDLWLLVDPLLVRHLCSSSRNHMHGTYGHKTACAREIFPPGLQLRNIG